MRAIVSNRKLFIIMDYKVEIQFQELIKKLDTPSEENASYKVIFLNNADAKKKAFQRVRRDLVEAGQMTVTDDVYFVKERRFIVQRVL